MNRNTRIFFFGILIIITSVLLARVDLGPILVMILYLIGLATSAYGAFKRDHQSTYAARTRRGRGGPAAPR